MQRTKTFAFSLVSETTAIIRDQANLWPGIYKVALEVKDQQGKPCADVQMVDVTVCTCLKNTKSCASRLTKTSGFGAAGVLLLLLGLLLLLCEFFITDSNETAVLM